MQIKTHALSPSPIICMVVLFCAAVVVAAPAQNISFTTLVDFDLLNGAAPSHLIQATDGNFYGTTWASEGGGGTVFKLTPAGTLTTLYNFCSQPNCTDGSDPGAGLIEATDGDFYGTTGTGGEGAGGTVFKLTPAGTLTTLYSFCYGCPGGANPGALVQGTDGNFYGTTSYGVGTVFKITPGGTLTTLYNFCALPNCKDGSQPEAGVMQDTDGNFYGTTEYGGTGTACGYLGCGTVFKITPGGTLTTLYSFCSQPWCSDGSLPQGGLVEAADGKLYGTTAFGGVTLAGAGTVFRISPGGMLTTLYRFCSQSNCPDGGLPYAGLVLASDGNFYGTTAGSAGAYVGTVFGITPTGTLTTLHRFTGPDGSTPFAGLIQATDRFFYGTTYAGGTHGYGTVFRVGVVGTCATCRP